MTPDPSYARKQYLIDRGYQLRFVTRIFAVVTVVAVASACLATILIWRHMHGPGSEPSLPLIIGLVAISTTLLVELLLAIPLIFILGIRQSHRIVGPMERIKKVLEAIGQGDFSQRVVLRQGDALQDVARLINKMTENLEQRFPNKPAA